MWPAPADAEQWIRRAGLPALPRERLEYHVHAHLDVLVDGRAEPVAALIGIDTVARVLSPLHTHDRTGIIHIESEAPRDFTLGQFLTEWAVRLTDACVGGYCRPAKPWRLYVNGNETSDSPVATLLHAHDELALVIGSPPAAIPSTFEFPAGF